MILDLKFILMLWLLNLSLMEFLYRLELFQEPITGISMFEVLQASSLIGQSLGSIGVGPPKEAMQPVVEFLSALALGKGTQ